MAIPVRRAGAGDTAELNRLREVMFASMGPMPDRSGWWDAATEALEKALAVPDGPMQAFVVDAAASPDVAVSGELASCAVGVVERRLPSPHNPTGLSGYVLSVATDPRHRRRGYARAVIQAALAWFESRGVERVELHSSPDAEAMYRSLGFQEPRGLALTRWAHRP
jgi:ribosomal protein S18 acetylase RimI-like enzyme